jgi:SAM-dependent methyltransferase
MFDRIVVGRFRERYIEEYVQPRPGERVFDIGCGPGDVLDHLPAVDYTGIDISPAYIRAAQGRFGCRGVFRCEDAAQAMLRQPASFDLVLANGVLHHLPDADARRLLLLARQALKPGGRLVTHDPCFVARQSRLARLLLRLDRGRFVRTQPGYAALARSIFRAVQSHIRHDLLAVPYTHHIMVCSVPHLSEDTSRALGRLREVCHAQSVLAEGEPCSRSLSTVR